MTTEIEDQVVHADFARQLAAEPVLRWFCYDHLPPIARAAVRPFAKLAQSITRDYPQSAERTIALRELQASKDAVLRCLALLGVVLALSACVCSVEPPPSEPVRFCARLEAYACPNAQCDERGEPTADRCDLAQVEACVAAIEASPSCYEAGGVASSDLCRTACASDGGL